MGQGERVPVWAADDDHMHATWGLEAGNGTPPELEALKRRLRGEDGVGTMQPHRPMAANRAVAQGWT